MEDISRFESAYDRLQLGFVERLRVTLLLFYVEISSSRKYYYHRTFGTFVYHTLVFILNLFVSLGSFIYNIRQNYFEFRYKLYYIFGPRWSNYICVFLLGLLVIVIDQTVKLIQSILCQ